MSSSSTNSNGKGMLVFVFFAGLVLAIVIMVAVFHSKPGDSNGISDAKTVQIPPVKSHVGNIRFSATQDTLSFEFVGNCGNDGGENVVVREEKNGKPQKIPLTLPVQFWPTPTSSNQNQVVINNHTGCLANQRCLLEPEDKKDDKAQPIEEVSVRSNIPAEFWILDKCQERVRVVDNVNKNLSTIYKLPKFKSVLGEVCYFVERVDDNPPVLVIGFSVPSGEMYSLGETFLGGATDESLERMVRSNYKKLVENSQFSPNGGGK